MVVSWVEMFRDSQRAPGVNIRPGLTAKESGSRTPGLTGSNFIITRRAFDDIDGFDTELPVMNDIDFMYRYLSIGGTYEVNSEDGHAAAAARSWATHSRHEDAG